MLLLHLLNPLLAVLCQELAWANGLHNNGHEAVVGTAPAGTMQTAALWTTCMKTVTTSSNIMPFQSPTMLTDRCAIASWNNKKGTSWE
jgi:hypothetical protein